jgi:hypothetical protein
MSVSVRIDDGLYQTIKTTANWNGISVTKYLNNLLEKGLTKELAEYHEAQRSDKGAFVSFCKQVDVTESDGLALIQQALDLVDFCVLVSKKFGIELTLDQAIEITKG